MRRRSSNTVKTLHSGHTFTSRDSFPPGVLPTKRQVIKRILHIKNFRTETAANDIAEEIHNRWVWCNVYPIHTYTISKKFTTYLLRLVHLTVGRNQNEEMRFYKENPSLCRQLMTCLMFFALMIDKEKSGETAWFTDGRSRFCFTKIKKVSKCVDTVVPLSSSDKMFLRRHSQPTGPTCSSIETPAPAISAYGYASDCSSVQTEQSQSSTTSEFVSVPDAAPFSQNRMK